MPDSGKRVSSIGISVGTVDVPNDSWSVTDRFLVDGRLLDALRCLRNAGGLSLHDAIEAADVRVTLLKANYPERFTVPLETYGRGVFT
jgi:hypothetical protein